MGTPYLSEIRLVGFAFAPKGWAQCDGQTLPINQNQALFSLMGTTYGGNGVSTFQLPNLQSRVAVHAGGSFALGQAGGEQTHTLTLSEMPAHTHTLNATSDLANASAPGLALPAARPRAGIARYGALGTSNTSLDPTTVSTTTGSQPHNNLQPYTTLNYVIALTGIFPSRN